MKGVGLEVGKKFAYGMLNVFEAMSQRPVFIARSFARFAAVILVVSATSLIGDDGGVDVFPFALDGAVRAAEERGRNLIGFSGGAGLGSFTFGGRTKHDFVFTHVYYGRIISDRIGDGSRWAGRWMLMGELTVGREFNPGKAWAVSVTPLFRYLFESSEKWVRPSSRLVMG